MIILFFGQPASGKTTLANKLKFEYKYCTEGRLITIDGDAWREVTQNKDYSKEGRIRNLKGAFDMALYLEKDDYIPILSFVTPYEELRTYLRENSTELIEIYLEYNEERGRTKNFAVDFEKPTGEFLSINTSEESIENCFLKIKNYVEEKITR